MRIAEWCEVACERDDASRDSKSSLPRYGRTNRMHAIQQLIQRAIQVDCPTAHSFFSLLWIPNYIVTMRNSEAVSSEGTKVPEGL